MPGTTAAIRRFWDFADRREYRVPKRFGILQILLLMTLFAVMFGGLRMLRAPTVIYVYFSVQAIIVCLVQMRFRRAVRGSSALVGALLLPLLLWLASFTTSWGGTPLAWEGNWYWLLWILVGGFLGYCTGALEAGVFLMLDLVEHWTRTGSGDPSD